MIDFRRVLPSVPLSCLSGMSATGSLASHGAPAGVDVVVGGLVFVAVLVGMYRSAATWSERSRRAVGYVATALSGLAVGAVLVFAAFAESLCNTWGETCTPDEDALVARYLWSAVVAVVGLPAIYAVLDLVSCSVSRMGSNVASRRRP